LFEQGKIDDTIEQFRSVLKIHPADAEMHCNLGVLLAQKGLVDEAIKELRTAVKLNPKLARAKKQLDAVLNESGAGGKK